MTDYYRLVFERLTECATGDETARLAVFAQCRAEVTERHADPAVRKAELAQLEKAIRRHALDALRDPAPGPSPLAHHDEVYAAIRFENLATGGLARGSVGWRDGAAPWVLLQVHGEAEASASAPSVQQAYDAAATALARRGFLARLAEGRFPFVQGRCYASVYRRHRRWMRWGPVVLGGVVLFLLGMMAGTAPGRGV